MDSLLLPGYIQATKFGTGADFAVYTGAMRPAIEKDLPPEDKDKPIVSMRGSSVIEDLQKDSMRLTALEDMTSIPKSLTFWLNHSYDLPDDAYGKLYGKPTIAVQSKIADLWVSADTFLSNPAAARTYNLIKVDGARFGCSIGCMVTEWSFVDPDDPWGSGIYIDHVYVLEFSIVGIPANQRCWVENAVKGIFARSLAEGNADAARSLAPAFRGLYTRQYDEILRNLTSDGLRKDLERVPIRGTASQRIMYDFGDDGFVLFGTKGSKKSLRREDIASLLEESDGAMKSASGKTSFPLVDIGTTWDGSKAESQIFSWAKGDGDSINAGKARQCFLYTDPENSDKQSGYKLPFCYIDGEPKIVPLGVRAVAGVLSGARGGLSGVSDADIASIKGKVKTMYGRINSQFKPDPEWVVPWEQGEKSVQDTDTGSPLIRQDLGEQGENEANIAKDMPSASDVKVAEDGTHEACTGSHSHAHKAYGSQGDDNLHSHEHSHDGDANHQHEHDQDKSQTADIQKDTNPDSSNVSADVHQNQSAWMTVYQSLVQQANTIGRELGLAPIMTDKAVIAVNIPPQDVITLISSIDSQVDTLMSGFGIPDIDEGPEEPEVQGRYSIAAEVRKALDEFFKVAEGREQSDKNRRILQTIHDCAKSMHPGVCDGDGAQHQSTDTDATQAESAANAEAQMRSYSASIEKQMEILAQFSSVIEGITARDMIESAVARALGESRNALVALKTEQDELQQHIRRLKDMPLGRPTQFIGRTVETEDGTATYNDFLSHKRDKTWSLEEALAQTELVERHDGMRCRCWPDGVGGEVGSGARPKLTENQKIYMNPMDVLRYNKGQKVLVPALDEAI